MKFGNVMISFVVLRAISKRTFRPPMIIPPIRSFSLMASLQLTHPTSYKVKA